MLEGRRADEGVEELQSLLDDAVRCRLRTAFPAGVLLSGGLDSSTVSCLAARHLRAEGRGLVAFSSVLPEGTDGPETDELRFIEDVVRQERGLELVRVDAPDASPFTGIDDAVRIHDGPFKDAFHYMSSALFETAASCGVRVLLDGYGGDFCVSTKAKSLLADLFRRGRWLELAGIIHDRRKRGERSSSLIHVARQILWPQAPPALWTLWGRWLKPGRQGALSRYAIHPEFARSSRAEDRHWHLGRSGRRVRRLPDVRRTIARSLEAGNVNLANEYFSNLAAACGIESSHPLLDRRLLELCVKLPLSAFLLDGQSRGLIRRAMRGVLPESVRLRSDKGPFAPDFLRRVRAGRSTAYNLLEDCATSSLAGRFIDLRMVRSTLSIVPEARGRDEATSTAVQVGAVLPLIAASFLKHLESGSRESMQGVTCQASGEGRRDVNSSGS